MTLTISPATAKVVVRAGGAVIAESTHALELREGSYPPVYYLPRADIGMAFLEPSDTATTCPHKGTASYFHMVAKSGTIRDVAWCYETPIAAAAAIAGHLAFYPSKATIELL